MIEGYDIGKHVEDNCLNKNLYWIHCTNMLCIFVNESKAIVIIITIIAIMLNVTSDNVALCVDL